VAGTLVARAATSASPWTLCLNQGGGFPGGIACSTDSGMTWANLPVLDDSGLLGYDAIGIADDGAVLARGSTNSVWRLYRLPRGGARWQALGDMPMTTGTLLYTHDAGDNGLLWSFPSVKGGGSGDANPSNVYVARYPY
jgi:hypothetical protein